MAYKIEEDPFFQVLEDTRGCTAFKSWIGDMAHKSIYDVLEPKIDKTIDLRAATREREDALLKSEFFVGVQEFAGSLKGTALNKTLKGYGVDLDKAYEVIEAPKVSTLFSSAAVSVVSDKLYEIGSLQLNKPELAEAMKEAYDHKIGHLGKDLINGSYNVLEDAMLTGQIQDALGQGVANGMNYLNAASTVIRDEPLLAPLIIGSGVVATKTVEFAANEVVPKALPEPVRDEFTIGSELKFNESIGNQYLDIHDFAINSESKANSSVLRKLADKNADSFCESVALMNGKMNPVQMYAKLNASAVAEALSSISKHATRTVDLRFNKQVDPKDGIDAIIRQAHGGYTKVKANERIDDHMNKDDAPTLHQFCSGEGHMRKLTLSLVLRSYETPSLISVEEKDLHLQSLVEFSEQKDNDFFNGIKISEKALGAINKISEISAASMKLEEKLSNHIDNSLQSESIKKKNTDSPEPFRASGMDIEFAAAMSKVGEKPEAGNLNSDRNTQRIKNKM